MSSHAIQVENIVKQFGGLRAVDDVSLSVPVGERHVLLGPNGAGKTTLFSMIGGQQKPTSGRVTLLGRDATRLNAHQRTHLGLGRTFQITSLFQDITVEENLQLAVMAVSRSRFNMLRSVESFAGMMDRVDELLETWRFGADRRLPVKELSYGDQRKLELAMAVANQPKILLLDEPTSGLSTAETASVVELIRGLPRSVTVLLVEHDMDVAFEVADRFTILHNGKLIMSGTESEVRGSRHIQEIYFGDSA